MPDVIEADFEIAYRNAYTLMLESMTLAGRLAVELRYGYQRSRGFGWEMPIAPPDAGFLNTEDSQSGLARLIRRAVESGVVRGDEDWLACVDWLEPESEPG